MIRYKLGGCRGESITLYSHSAKDPQCENIAKLYPDHPTFLDILEQDNWSWKVRIYQENGEILVGWLLKALPQIDIYNEHELFDGRFNANQLGE